MLTSVMSFASTSRRVTNSWCAETARAITEPSTATTTNRNMRCRITIRSLVTVVR